MYSTTQIAFKYLRYLITASNGKGHGIHSPFVYDFIRSVLNDRQVYPDYRRIESLRKDLRSSRETIEVKDFGAGSVKGSPSRRRVASIAASAAKPAKPGQLLYRVARHYKPATMLELGTSLGISGAYLSCGHPAGRLITCEGSPAIAALAAKSFETLRLSNVEIHEGDFDSILPSVLEKAGGIDLAFIDGNHREEPTLRYFQQIIGFMNRPGILIFDDIHWSEGMERAWEAIKLHPQSMLTVDLFFMGIVFLSADFKVQQHFSIRF